MSRQIGVEGTAYAEGEHFFIDLERDEIDVMVQLCSGEEMALSFVYGGDGATAEVFAELSPEQAEEVAESLLAKAAEVRNGG